VHQHETAGTVGVLGHAGFKAGLPEQRRLLVAGEGGQRDIDTPDARTQAVVA
jgi:hypothetical protein